MSERHSQSLLVRADVSTRMGAGHAMRCFALAKAWQNTGGCVTFAMAETIPGIEARFRNNGVQVEHVASNAGSREDADETSNLARRNRAGWTVVDGYQFAPAYHRQLKDSGLRVLMVDDDGRFPEYCADFVLNQNLAANEQMYARRGSCTRLLLGTEYALLRPEFLAGAQSRETPPVARHLLVTMGGSDADNVTLKVMQALAGVSRGLETTIVVGLGNPHSEQLGVLAGGLPQVRLERNPPDMASLMRRADMAVSAAGSTCWELAFLGVPMIVAVLATNQQGIAKVLAEGDVAVSLGWHANLSPSQISEAIEQLAGDSAHRLAMSKAGQKLVDGRGAERVVKVLQNSL